MAIYDLTTTMEPSKYSFSWAHYFIYSKLWANMLTTLYFDQLLSECMHCCYSYNNGYLHSKISLKGCSSTCQNYMFFFLIESSLQIMLSAYIDFICQVTGHLIMSVENIHV
jgi:hypothetical protein